MSNLPSGIVHTGTHGGMDTGPSGHARPVHHQEVTVDCCRIDWGWLGRLEGWLLAVPLVRTGTKYVSGCLLSVPVISRH